MSPLLSQEKRQIYKRKIINFWDDFSHNTIGFVGLILLLIFVGMAVFAPWLTPYDPVASPRVAESMAMPSWMTMFPQYSDYPPTYEISPSWTVETGTEYVVGGKNVEGTFYGAGEQLRQTDITLTTSFNYPHTIPSKRFVAIFDWQATNITNVWVSAELLLINQHGNSTRVWFEPATQINTLITIRADSTEWWLLKKLGFTDPKAINLAYIVFSAPTKGEYNLIFHIALTPQEGAQTASVNLGLKRFVFLIPGLQHGILGTDFSGADVFSQLIYGTQISLMIGLMAAAISVSIGVLVGTIAGYIGGAVDEISMRIVDILLCLPFLPLLLTLVRLFGKNVFYIVLFIAVFGWLGLSRIIRSQILYLRESAFVESAIAAGASKGYVMIRHLVPNIAPIALASLVLSVPGAILLEAGLSFLGFGDPRVPTWGKMLNQAFGHGAFENFAWWWAIPPGLAITFVTLAFVFLGFAIDEIVNPKLRRRR
jgi:ABC-type dipeptide/oligopeptide/nickel transport system permease subunit